MPSRYALYYTPPPEHPLWQAGCAWLGRDPADASDQRPAPAGRRSPWRYGFHATLKPPLRLCAIVGEAQLHAAIARLAEATACFEMPALAVAPLADFLALRPARPLARGHALWRLADACVRELDAFRAPPDAAELARRGAGLDAAQSERLQQWGYAHVLDGWRFHLTLSDNLAAPALATLQREARAHFAAALAQPLRCEAISLFVELAPGLPLQLHRRYALSAAG